MVTQMTRLTVTIKPELKAIADEIARENKTSRSRIISQCLEELARNRKEKSLIRYYTDMAKEHGEFAKQSVKIIQNIASSWSD